MNSTTTPRRKRIKQARALPDLSDLKEKPHWWLELHRPVEITGEKWPDGIHARAIHDGVTYEGILSPKESED